jgi:hypothetical protein
MEPSVLNGAVRIRLGSGLVSFGWRAEVMDVVDVREVLGVWLWRITEDSYRLFAF